MDGTLSRGKDDRVDHLPSCGSVLTGIAQLIDRVVTFCRTGMRVSRVVADIPQSPALVRYLYPRSKNRTHFSAIRNDVPLQWVISIGSTTCVLL